MNGARVRFLADANFDMVVVRGLRHLQPAIDVMSADEAQLRGVPDPAVLAIAAREKRLLLTHDKRTMPQHFADFLAMGKHSPGVFLLPQEGSIKDSIDALHLIWEASAPDEWADMLIYLP
jgi:hypothetical protein